MQHADRPTPTTAARHRATLTAQRAAARARLTEARALVAALTEAEGVAWRYAETATPRATERVYANRAADAVAAALTEARLAETCAAEAVHVANALVLCYDAAVSQAYDAGGPVDRAAIARRVTEAAAERAAVTAAERAAAERRAAAAEVVS